MALYSPLIDGDCFSDCLTDEYLNDQGALPIPLILHWPITSKRIYQEQKKVNRRNTNYLLFLPGHIPGVLSLKSASLTKQERPPPHIREGHWWESRCHVSSCHCVIVLLSPNVPCPDRHRQLQEPALLQETGHCLLDLICTYILKFIEKKHAN